MPYREANKAPTQEIVEWEMDTSQRRRGESHFPDPKLRWLPRRCCVYLSSLEAVQADIVADILDKRPFFPVNGSHVVLYNG